ncbi:MAG: hypothetical protein LUE11_12720 [Clostridia bacterium]|nr:hypothetical protein [Clostridia bacterium]
MPLESAMELAKFYNVSLHYLVGITERPSPHPKD